MRRRLAAAVTVAATFAATLVIVLPGGAAGAAPKHKPVDHRPTLYSTRLTVVQDDPITLNGPTALHTVTIYRKLSTTGWSRLGTATASHGYFRFPTRPVIGRTNYYQATAARTAVNKSGMTKPVAVRSARCDPLPAAGSVASWFGDATSNGLALNWAHLLCSAAPGSTITLAEMFVYENSTAVYRLMTALRNLSAYRGVHVRVLVQRDGYYDTAAEWKSLRRHFSFAEVHYCSHGCHSSNVSAHAHTKFTVVSKTIFGGPAVLEASANWSGAQFEGNRQSGVYVYGNRRLTTAFLDEWTAMVTHTTLAPALWTSAGNGISYSFDPHPTTADPIVSELSTLTCQPGDSIGVTDPVLSRPALVAQLTRLQSAGCTVRALIAPDGSAPKSVTFPVQVVTVHDKFLLITAHSTSGAPVHEVIHGSENFTTLSMTVSDQQLLLIRRDDVWNSYRGWFGHLWNLSLPPVVAPTPPVAAPVPNPTTGATPTPDPTTDPGDTDAGDVRTPASVGGAVRASVCPQPIASADDDSTAGACAAR